MSPSDTDPQREKRRHRVPLIIMGLAVVFGVGMILLWITEEADMAPGPEASEQEAPAAELSEGDVNVPADALTETVEPGDGEVVIEE